MNNYEKLQKEIEKLRAIKTKMPTELADSLKSQYAAEFAEIQGDEKLSAIGKKLLVDELRTDLAFVALNAARDAKNDYVRIAKNAVKLAKAVKNEELPKPAADDLQLFETALSTLKLDVALSITVEKAIEKIGEFLKQYAVEPYYAKAILNSYGELVNATLAINNSPQARLQLGKLKDTLEGAIESEEIKLANEVLIDFARPEDFKLFRSESVQFKAIREVIGGHATRLLATDYEAEIAALEGGEA